MRDTMRKLIKRNEDRPTQNGGGKRQGRELERERERERDGEKVE